MAFGCGLCPALGTFFALAAAVLLIFANIGQISVTQTVPRNLRIIDLTTYGVPTALQTLTGLSPSVASQVFGNPNQTQGSYDVGSGLRQVYSWGLWSRCGGYGGLGDLQFCTDTQFAQPFQPLEQVFIRDIPGAQNASLLGLIPSSTFTADTYLGNFSKAAFWLIFVGAILTGLGILIGFAAHRFAFVLTALLVMLAFVCEAAGAAIWTAITIKVRDSINDVVINANGASAPLGINVDYGNALWLIWAASGCLLLAILPYLLGCCTGRASVKEDYY